MKFDDVDSKRFQGTLDKVFQQQRTNAAATAPEEENEDATEADAETAKAEQLEKVKAAQPKEEKQLTVTPSQVEEKEKEVQKKIRQEEVKAKQLAAAGDAAGEGMVEPPAKKEKREHILDGDVQPHGMTLGFASKSDSAAARLFLHLPKDAEGNKKLPPRTILYKLVGEAAGKIEKCKDNVLPWNFEKTSKTLVAEKLSDGVLGQVVDLATLIKQKGATSVVKHSPTFPAGQPPSSLNRIMYCSGTCRQASWLRRFSRTPTSLQVCSQFSWRRSTV